MSGDNDHIAAFKTTLICRLRLQKLTLTADTGKKVKEYKQDLIMNLFVVVSRDGTRRKYLVRDRIGGFTTLQTSAKLGRGRGPEGGGKEARELSSRHPD